MSDLTNPNTSEVARWREAINDLGDQLCQVATGSFGFRVESKVVDETLDKFSMLVNFLIESSRISLDNLQRSNEKLTELGKMRSMFLANISHELRTPLALVMGPLERVLRDKNLPAHLRADVGIACNNARRLLKHVNDLLDVTKLDASKMAPQKSEVDFGSLTAMLCAHFDALAQEKKIDFRVRVDGSFFLHADAEMLSRILLNVLSHAFKYTPPEGTIECALTHTPTHILLTLSDSGEGVQLADRDLIFQCFERGKIDPQNNVGGTGLGLALVKEFAELHGGSVRIDDSPWGGALFEVALPRVLETQALDQTQGSLPLVCSNLLANQIAVETCSVRALRLASSPSSQQVLNSAKNRANGLVLVVEDNPEMRTFIAEILAEDYAIEVAENGAEGLERIAQHKPDLVVSDVMMPLFSGEDLLRAVRKTHSLLELPVLMMTARADDESRSTILADGANDFLIKPFPVAELKARVGNLIKTKRAADFMRSEVLTTVDDLEGMARELVRQRSELTAANKLKEEFLATVSHELRTPLTALMGWIHLLGADEVTDPQSVAVAVGIMDRNCNHLLGLVNDLLDVSKMEREKGELDLMPVDLMQLVHESVQNFRIAAESKGISLVARFESESWIVNGEPEKLSQIVTNLLANAVKFTPRQGSVCVNLKRVNSHAVLEICDTGHGVEPEFIPYVFERFRQENGSKSRSFGGLGLGISIVKSLVDLHGGKVELESPGRGQGATVRVSLPLLQFSHQSQLCPFVTASSECMETSTDLVKTSTDVLPEAWSVSENTQRI